MEKMESKNVIRLSKSCISHSEKLAVMGVLDREFLGMGSEVQQFELSLTEFFGRSAVCVVNGTAALQLALEACGIGSEDEVLVQSLTYVASFQAISATGAKPVACDIDPKTLTLDWRDAEKRLTTNTKAVMPVHYSGGVGDLDEIYEFARKHGLRVIEDAAHSFGTVYKDKRVGGFGDIACFSFDGIKNITCGEGGCIVTDDIEVLNKLRDKRLLGIEKDTEKRYAAQRSWEFNVKAQGWRYHMSNIMAAIGIEQLKRFQYFAEKRQKLSKLYNQKLIDLKTIKLIAHNYQKVVPHIYVIKLPRHVDRNLLRDRLSDYGVQTGIHYQPNHLLEMYFQEGVSLPKTDETYSSLLSLPLHPDLEERDVVKICDFLKKEII